MRENGRSRNVAAVRLMAAPVLFLLAATASQAEPTPPHKSIKTCNAELDEHAAEIDKAGESRAAFFHACWTRAVPGQPTPIEASAKVEKHAEKEPAAARRTRPPRERRIVTRRLVRDAVEPSEDASRAAPPVEDRALRDPDFPAPRATPAESAATAPLPPTIASTAETLGRALRAAGLPHVEVPVLVPGTLEVVPVTIVPR